MSRLYPNSQAAERLRGCKFADTFESAANVAENGGTITGSPTFDPSTGVTLSGATDGIIYSESGILASDEISFIAEFSPSFDFDSDQVYYLFQATGDIYNILKNNNAANNHIRIRIGSTTIAQIPSATYSPFWLVNQRNVLVVSSSSGDTNAWLNGNQILTNDTTAWTPTVPAQIAIGNTTTSANVFDGSIKSFKIYHSLLTAQEATDIYNETTFNYKARALVDYPLLTAQHDVANVRTLDVSGNGHNATFGDGSTGTTYPTKLTKRGYSFDGGDYFQTGNITGQTTLSFSCLVNIQDISSTKYIGSYTDSGGSNIQFVCLNTATQIRFYVGGITAANSAQFNHSGVGLYHIVGVHDGTDTKIYVNGTSPIDATTPLAPMITASQYLVLGATNSAGSRMTGDMFTASVYGFALTETQAKDLFWNDMYRIQHV